MLQSRSIKMTLIICTGLLMTCISIAELLLSRSTVNDTVVTNLIAQQGVSMHVLVEQFANRFDGITVETAPDGTVARIIWDNMPEITDSDAVNAYAAMTNELGTLLLWDPAKQDFVRTATNVKTAEGTLALGTPLGQDHPGRAALMRKDMFSGQVNMLGKTYLAQYVPILTSAGDVVGGFFVGIDRTGIDARLAQETFKDMIAMAMMVAVILGALVWLISFLLRPLAQLGSAIQKVADGDLDTPVPFAQNTNEVGVIAARVEGFREKLKAARQTDAVVHEQQQEAAAVVQTLRAGLGQLASGDLTRMLHDPFPPRFEELRTDFNATVKTLSDLIGALAQNASAIRARAHEISGASENLSHRTENQAATLEQTAAALDELTASVRSASQSAVQVENVVSAARQHAEASSVVVSDATAAMAGIESSSDKISQIITVIDDIAFQTNLLALNAGVEAARAGDAGRGFAVVASEVRALAQRSSEAAKEIKTLIGTSSKQVVAGVGLVNRAGSALSDIVGRVGEIANLMSGIAAAAKEQALGLEEINTGVSQLDQVTQQNAAMVEEVTAASGVLGQEAEGLDALVAKFDVGGSQRAVATGLVFTAAPRHSAQQTPRSPARDSAKSPPPKRAANAGTWQDF